MSALNVGMEYSYTTALLGIDSLAPCVHDEGIVDGDNVDITSILGLGVGNVAWEMGIGAAWAYLRQVVSNVGRQDNEPGEDCRNMRNWSSY